MRSLLPNVTKVHIIELNYRGRPGHIGGSKLYSQKRWFKDWIGGGNEMMKVTEGEPQDAARMLRHR